MAEEIRVIDRLAENAIGGAGWAAEIIKEIRKASVIGAVSIGVRSALVERRTLPSQLPEELTAITEGMVADDLRLCILQQPVVGEPKLRDVGRNPWHGDVRNSEDKLSKRLIDRTLGNREVEPDATIREAELVGPGRV